MIKKTPMRTCIACKECKPKKELVRIVRNDNGFTLDKTGKLNGRGAYICNKPECFDLLFRNKLLNKTFKTNVSQDDYNKIKEEYERK